VSRGAAVAVVAGLVTVLLGSCSSRSENEGVKYCAIMPDSVGLYVDNPVTQMGYEIGKVDSLTPGALDVRVDFTITKHRLFPGDVKAIIRSPSILADRSLELVGNYESEPRLTAGECIPLERSSTPKSLSEVIGSATEFANQINPDGSTNIGDVVQGIDDVVQGNGAGINGLLTRSSALLDSPDHAISDIASIITNLGQLTSLIKELRGPLKQTLYDAVATLKDIQAASIGGRRIVEGVLWVTPLVEDLEVNLGQETQFTLDATQVFVRKLAEHAPRTANLLNFVPWWVNTAANHFNNRPLRNLRYRPPMYRIHTPDGVAQCNIMNGFMPGSCANVQGQPYAVDAALLQYVLNLAAAR
jgi:virulence factor Mce-like protein